MRIRGRCQLAEQDSRVTCRLVLTLHLPDAMPFALFPVASLLAFVLCCQYRATPGAV